MNTQIIAFDESGNTGQNLLDENQPYFALGSVNYNEDQLDEIFKIFDSSAVELHFKSLKKYQKSKKQIIELCNHDLLSFKNVKYYIVNKKIALIGHIVDRFIEPVLYEIGKNIYKDRSNLVLTNLLYVFSQQAWNKDLVKKFLFSFQNFIRQPSIKSISEFYSSNSNLIKSIDDDNQKNLLKIIDSSKLLMDIIIDSIEPYTIDLTFPTFNVLTHKWYEELNSTFEIIHDNSKAIEFWKSVIEILADPQKMDEKEVGYGNEKMTYPLKFTKLELVNSEDYRLVQIADLLTSSLCFGLKNQFQKNEIEFVKQLWQSKLFNIEHVSMRPIDDSILMSFILEGDQIGTDALDYLTEMHVKNEVKNTE